MQIEITPEYLATQGLSPTFPERFWAKVNKDGPVPEHMPHLGKCWVWTASAPGHGYGQIGCCKGKHNMIRAHVASWILHYGPVPKDMDVCHSCDRPSCCRPDHLFLGTAKRNMEDCVRKKRQSYGEHRPGHKLSDEKVAQIRSLYKPQVMSQRKLAEMFGVSTGCIQMVIEGRTWKHVNKLAT